ncbi:PREDICTED: zinc-binding alcohol dehydrogenase domain-containing protein 2 [Nanorana parkeri]|uniref:zinc-binding alcohol dehydrogenase domain-containing protein 2 n=1 Tax=Nanorana parkeri TaxID=125878 RepID=UPI0008544E3D|nr:PREDICTED: zinc-binding alcohol dehydrogenase domain-containing protein 2 [Nanorana parkeri]
MSVLRVKAGLGLLARSRPCISPWPLLCRPGARPIVDMSYSHHFVDFHGSSIPTSMKKLVVTQLSPDFRKAVTLMPSVAVPVPGDGDLLIRNRYVGINASDINFSSGRYDASVKPPFDVGFEGIGEVVALGLSASKNFAVGQPVAYVQNGSFAEYTVVPAMTAIPIPLVTPDFLTFLISGTTAYISLKEFGNLSKGKKVLVTAAGGGTGQFAVQLAKHANCYVIGTCSSEEKAGFLKSIGCDLPINYKAENVASVIREKFPEGVDVVYESVGGEMFDLAVKCLATKGHLIIIGFISGYATPLGILPVKEAALPAVLLKKSASVHGFFLPHYMSEYKEAIMSLVTLHRSGKLVCEVDNGELSPEGKFTGLESVFRAVDYLYTGKNIGKIVVELPHLVNSKL